MAEGLSPSLSTEEMVAAGYWVWYDSDSTSVDSDGDLFEYLLHDLHWLEPTYVDKGSE